MSAEAFVLDASVTLAWCFEDEWARPAEAILDLLESREALVPPLWLLEVGGALLGAERRNRLATAEVTYFLELLRSLPIHLIEGLERERAWGEILHLARTYQLSTYDATYLDLAMRNGLPLATLDHALQQAAAQVGVALL